jgi:hypothetical protein
MEELYDIYIFRMPMCARCGCVFYFLLTLYIHIYIYIYIYIGAFSFCLFVFVCNERQRMVVIAGIFICFFVPFISSKRETTQEIFLVNNE